MRGVSVIICTHNRAQLLTDALASLKKMKQPLDCAVEVIVVDNASTDNTSGVISEFSENSGAFSFNALSEPRLGKTYALNAAINNAGPEVLVFTDDDHIVSSNFLEEINKALSENPDINIFCGRVLPNWDGTEPEWIHDNKKYPIRPFPIPNFDLGGKKKIIESGRDSFIPGAGNLILRKGLFKRVEYFSEQIGPRGHNLRGGEDIEFLQRALKTGERILYVPEILQYHQVDSSKLTLAYLVKKAYMRSMALSQFSENCQNNSGGVPAYLYKQAFSRFFRLLFAISRDARRYYMVRLAAALGEIQGLRKKLKAV